MLKASDLEPWCRTEKISTLTMYCVHHSLHLSCHCMYTFIVSVILFYCITHKQNGLDL